MWKAREVFSYCREYQCLTEPARSATASTGNGSVFAVTLSKERVFTSPRAAALTSAASAFVLTALVS